MEIWGRPWLPIVFFALISVVYFAEFVVSDKVIFGSDVGTDFHQGANESFTKKLGDFVQPVWGHKMGGFPLSEELRHQYFPMRLFYLFTSYQRYLGWRYLLTVFAAGCCMYVFLRNLGLGRWVAFWAGVAYLSAPTFLSFPYAGHYAKMSVISMFPLMCWCVDRGVGLGRPVYFAGLAVLIALGVFSPHLQMLYYALWGIGFYFLFRFFQGYRQAPSTTFAFSRVGLFSLAVILGLGIGAEGLLPSYMHTKTQSKRGAAEDGAGKSAAEQLAFARSWSLHPEEVTSLLVPEFGGFYDPANGKNYYWGRNSMKLNSEYFGILVIILAALALPGIRGRPLSLFMGGIFLFALAYALGGHTPVHWIFYHLAPGANVLRTPGMIAFLFSFAACVLAAQAFERIISGTIQERDLQAKQILWTGGILSGLTLALALVPKAWTGIWISLFYADIAPAKMATLEATYDWLAGGALVVALVGGIGTGLLYFYVRRQLNLGVLITGFVVLTLFDTWRIDRLFLKYENPAQYKDVRQENRRTVDFINEQGGYTRVLPLPGYNILSQPGYHLYDIPAVTGFHDFTLRRYDRILEEISSATALFEAKYYRRQQIPYSDEELLKAIHPLVNLVSAKYIATPKALELKVAGFSAVFDAENLRLYENPEALPWFSLVPSYQVVTDGEKIIELLRSGLTDPRHTAILEQEPTPSFGAEPGETTAQDLLNVKVYDRDLGLIHLEARSAGPRILVVAENFHPNWHVFVDGAEAKLLRANYIWKAVALEAGAHTVEFRYRSSMVGISRIITIVSLIIVLGIGIWDYRNMRQRVFAADDGVADTV